MPDKITEVKDKNINGFLISFSLGKRVIVCLVFSVRQITQCFYLPGVPQKIISALFQFDNNRIKMKNIYAGVKY
jgi:hypothetical protein